MTLPQANVPSFSNLMKQQMKRSVMINATEPMWVSVKLERQGESVTVQRLGNGITILGSHPGMIAVGLQAVRLRWVLTPDLDGRQLQYSFATDEWHPIATEFHASKLETDKVYKLVEVKETSHE